jgi:hypothetical protein
MKKVCEYPESILKIDWGDLTDNIGCLLNLDKTFELPQNKYQEVLDKSKSLLTKFGLDATSAKTTTTLSSSTTTTTTTAANGDETPICILDHLNNDLVICHQLSKPFTRNVLNLYAVANIPKPLSETHPIKLPNNQVCCLLH